MCSIILLGSYQGYPIETGKNLVQYYDSFKKISKIIIKCFNMFRKQLDDQYSI